MNELNGAGKVASLHLHPIKTGEPLSAVQSIELVAGNGIKDDPRYFGRISRSSGKPSRRQVTLIEREQIAEHAATLALERIAPGAVRSNIETTGINLINLIGREIQIGTARLRLYAPRDPCEKMDAICQGLREQMMHNRQGVLAEVIAGGLVSVGESIRVL